jgi:hypothetical protein
MGDGAPSAAERLNSDPLGKSQAHQEDEQGGYTQSHRRTNGQPQKEKDDRIGQRTLLGLISG